MPPKPNTHFEDENGVEGWKTEWGRWWQTVDAVHIEITDLNDVKGKDVSLEITGHSIKCAVRNEVILEGRFYRLVRANEVVWTIEDKSAINIVIAKAGFLREDIMWESLFEDGRYEPDWLTLHEMRKRIEKEQFKIDNPDGYDFDRGKAKKS